MKKLIFLLAIIFGISAVSLAQKSSKMKPKDGVAMVDNKATLVSHGKYTPLTKTYTCTDKCEVSSDGTITKPDGTTMKLENGYEIYKNGKIAMIPHGSKGHVCGPTCPMYKKM